MARRNIPSPLHRSLELAYANAAIWGVGSGLASVSLITYFARELHAGGLAISWILAAPSLVGLLRLLTPRWLKLVGNRRRFCIGMFLASSVALAALPMLAAPGRLPSQGWSVVMLGATWTVYQAFEFIGVVALWSWFGDLAPRAIRGRFVGRREAWLTAGTVLGGLQAALATWYWQQRCEALGQPELLWQAYAACASFGASLTALATLPLARMVDLPMAPPAGADRQVGLAALWRPLADPRFRRLLTFGVWFSAANGLVQSPRRIFLASVLKVELAENRTLDALSRGAQSLLMPWTGAVVDRRGNARVLTVSWGIVSLATIFLLLATPQAKWWIVGAYVCWIAYAGLNVTLPNLMLGLSPRGETTDYAAAWFAWTQLAYSLGALAGGALLDWLAQRFQPRSLFHWRLDRFTLLLAVGGALMGAGVLWASRVPEPPPDDERSPAAR